jgi:membrane associated rhomboid family serine protease
MLSLKRSATTAVITIIAAAYLYNLVFGGLQIQFELPNFDRLTSTGEWYRLLTVALVHGGIFHLGFNLFALMALGNPVESALGKKGFFIVFFVSLISGSLFSSYFAAFNQYSVGVSGAVFGLFGAFAVISRRYGLEIKSIAVIVGINFAMGFVIGGVDWRAHLGGLIGGSIAAAILLPKRR